MIKRLLACLLTILIALDQLVQALVRSPLYIITGRHEPSPRETISAWAGTMTWDEPRELIDGIFGQGHCARAALLEKAWLTEP